MGEQIILVDFGASRIKSVLWSFADGCATAIRECEAPKPRPSVCGEVEFEPEDYWKAFEETVVAFASSAPQATDVWLCTEMHGFMLVDENAATPLTPYISWQDQRACQPIAAGESTLQTLQPHADSFMHHTGMRLRAGLPGLNLAHMARLGTLPTNARFATLSDWLLLRAGETAPETHATLAAGTGLYSLKESGWFPSLMPGLESDLAGLHFFPVNDLSRPLGQVRLAGRALRVWGGIGDMQAAAHGAKFPAVSPVLINLGTGSQVMVLPVREKPGVDRRLSASGQLFQTVTHIPCGRALNVFASLLDECARMGGGAPFFWSLFAELTAEEVLEAPDCVDLNVFQASWKYAGGGKLWGIQERSLSPRTLARSIARSWLQQYADALKTISPNHPGTSFLLSGGLSRRANFIAPVLEYLLGRSCVAPVLRTGEETLDGLLFLAEGDPFQLPQISSPPQTSETK
jgi:sugar (pentulose or hexulose) kinase